MENELPLALIYKLYVSCEKYLINIIISNTLVIIPLEYRIILIFNNA